ncbi:MAG: glutamate racemase [Bacteroidetes bacterium]|nr:glutamate racemase [Bacteroidota bacterium]
MVNNTSPIGIMDSGIGGLTIAKSIKSVLPSETLFYFGDTVHLPYGDKSPKAIIKYSNQIADFLFGSGCKLLVIACNSASVSAYDSLIKKWGNDKIINVIDPVVATAAEFNSQHVGVIGTKRTISSKVYFTKLTNAGVNKVSELATPLLANMIEEGFINNSISHALIENYITRPKLAGIDSLILACTHYPLISAEIASFLDKNVKILDSTIPVAQAVLDNLTARDLLSTEANNIADDKFWVSDLTSSFQKTARMFFGEEINNKKKVLK